MNLTDEEVLKLIKIFIYTAIPSILAFTNIFVWFHYL